MCGRYFLNIEQVKNEINDIDQQVDMNQISINEIFPSNTILTRVKDGYKAIKWGVKTDWSKSLLINARVETVSTKPFFKKDFQSNRCVIVATSYFEWTPTTKQKYEIYPKHHSIIYLAGIIKNINGEEEVIILTQDADTSINHIHHRMPVILTQSEVDAYLYDGILPLKNLELSFHKAN